MQIMIWDLVLGPRPSTWAGGHQVQGHRAHPMPLVLKVWPGTPTATAPGNTLEAQILGPCPRKDWIRNSQSGVPDPGFSKSCRGLQWHSASEPPHNAMPCFLHLGKSVLPICIWVLECLYGFDISQSLCANYCLTKGSFFRRSLETFYSQLKLHCFHLLHIREEGQNNFHR